MNIPIIRLLATVLFFQTASPLWAQVPQIINYQGKVAVAGTPFTGTGQFRFALVNGTGATTYWSNDGTSTAGSQPTAAVSLPVVNGLYVVPLGDATIANMTPVTATVFANADVRLRVWFDDSTNGSQLLSPDQRITSVGYAMVAGSVPDGAITTAKIAATARPKFDRQMILAPINPVAPSTLSDIPGVTLTTKSLGENGTYRVEYNLLAILQPGDSITTLLNVGGTDLEETRSYAMVGYFGGNSSFIQTTRAAILTGIAPGTVVKLKAQRISNNATPTLFYPSLLIDGVPSSQVVP